MTQHASLTAERWAQLDRDRQILAIANEMNRAGKLFAPEDRSSWPAGCTSTPIPKAIGSSSGRYCSSPLRPRSSSRT